MPANLTAEYFKVEQEYQDAKTTEQKIIALKKMLAACPKHKGSEKMQKEIKERIRKLKYKKEKETRKTKGRGGFSLTKIGDAQVCILGMTQTGKSTLISKLTNAMPKISDIPYTTKRPEVGMIEWMGVKIQLVEIPSTFENIYMSIAQNCDGIIIVARNEYELPDIRKAIEQFKIKIPFIEVLGEYDDEMLKEKIWNMLDLIRIYTKEPGKKPETKALVLKKDQTVKDAARKVHKDFIKFFSFARVWGKSSKYGGQSFGLGHILKDGDIVEFHLKK